MKWGVIKMEKYSLRYQANIQYQGIERFSDSFMVITKMLETMLKLMEDGAEKARKYLDHASTDLEDDFDHVDMKLYLDDAVQYFDADSRSKAKKLIKELRFKEFVTKDFGGVEAKLNSYIEITKVRCGKDITTIDQVNRIVLWLENAVDKLLNDLNLKIGKGNETLQTKTTKVVYKTSGQLPLETLSFGNNVNNKNMTFGKVDINIRKAS